MKRLIAWAGAAMFASSLSVAAQETCGGTYTVTRGDSLSLIADELYQNASQWTAIHAANLSSIGDNPNAIRVGMKLSLTCINGLPKGLPGGAVVTEAVAPAPLQVAPGNAATRQKINILTGSDFAPFTHKELPNGGLLADVVQKAMEAAAPEQGFAVHWVDDWASHHEPLLSNALLDIGFPWFQPNCEAEPNTYRCENLLFSESMFEVLMLIFVNKDRPMAFNSNADMQGKTLCRPSGYSTFIFDHEGRNWLRDGLITLEQPTSPADCIEMVAEGKADGAVLNEFLGRDTIKKLGLGDQIVVAQGRPVSIDGNHMIVHKSHPNGPELLAVFEQGLERIKADGTYRRIVDEHMTRIWATF
ncbi:MAG: transporter substrate-binding domain-containing protein [Paracoccaceae bacterium]|nr:transporter substrate-binding domain-containing protein [Paracoccaceae bacterium]